MSCHAPLQTACLELLVDRSKLGRSVTETRRFWRQRVTAPGDTSELEPFRLGLATRYWILQNRNHYIGSDSAETVGEQPERGNSVLTKMRAYRSHLGQSASFYLLAAAKTALDDAEMMTPMTAKESG